MRRRNMLSSLFAISLAAGFDYSYAQFSLDDPYDKKKKTPAKDLSTLPKDKMTMGFAWGERFSPPQKFSRGLINLQEALVKQAKLEVTTNSKVILGSDKIFDNSVLFFTSEKSFDISEAEKANLKKYLENDGFVILDSFPFSNEETNPSRVGDGRKGEASLRQMILDAMGTSVRFSPIPKNHEIYSNVNTFEDGPPIGGEYLKSIDANYTGANESKDKLLPKSEPIVDVKGYLDGIYIGNKLVGISSSKGYFIKWSEMTNNEPQLKMGVNMIVYGLSN